MNPTRFILPALLASPLLLALEPRGDALTFHPAKDSTLTKVNDITMSFELGDMSVMVDGADMSGQIPADFNGEMDMSMTWTDKYVDFKQDGSPAELIRTYDEMRGSMDVNAGGESESNDIPEFDALTGKSIKFKWDEEKQSYEITFHESEGDEKLLKTQQIDMDFRSMLPPEGEVVEGKTWEVPTKFLQDMIEQMKNGDMGDDEAGIATILQDELFPQLEKMVNQFKTICKYEGKVEEDGVSAGQIAITIEGKGELDLKSMIEAIVTEQVPPEAGVELDIRTATIGFTMTGKGKLLWDIASGHLLSLDQSADFTVNFDVDASADAGGQSHTIEAQVEMPGKFSSKVSLKK
jgi:hypothetical protein